jgi:hypothetical protein
MAKTLFGAIVSDARGKVAGTVFSKNFFGTYIKKKTSPGALYTPAKASSVAAFSASAKKWMATLSQTYRDHWIDLATANPVPDIFGTLQKLSGIAMFIRVNRELKLIGHAQMPDAPADQATHDIAGITPTYTPGPPYHLSLTVNNPPTGDDQLVVCASTFISPGRRVPKANRIAFVQAFPPAHGSPFDFTDYWNAKYASALQFGAIAVAAYAIRNTNGAAGKRYAQLLLIG